MKAASPSWDLIILGGGIVGCATALYAAREGMSCLIVERDMIASAQSGRNLGFVRQQGRDFRELPLMIASLRLWEGIEADLGRSVGWHQGGNISLAMSEADLASRSEWQRRGREEFGLDVRMLSASETLATVPHLSSEVGILGAMYTPSDGRAEPGRATRAFFEAALEHGVSVSLGKKATRIDTGAGRVTGVWVGDRLHRAETVVCAAGTGSADLLRAAGLGLPQERIRATVARTERRYERLAQCVSGPTTGIRQDADGAFVISVAGGEYDVRFDSWRHMRWYASTRRENPDAARINYLAPFQRLMPRRVQAPLADIAPTSEHVAPEAWRAEQAYAEFCRLFPALADTGIMTSWAGCIDTLPDVVPAIGPVAGIGGLLVATGFSGHGFGPGPMAGKVMAALASGRPAGVDLTGLSPDRFRNSKPA
jgi:glycine/D-amino acid oxidase-like deaminating enzyme